MIINLIIIPIFIVFLFISLKFIFGNEGKDERGQHIINISYMFSFPLFPIGWLILESYHKYVVSLDFNQYRDLLSLLIPLTFILQGLVILIMKKRM